MRSRDMRFKIVTQLFFILVVCIPNICIGGQILKIQNNKILATLGDLDADFVAEGDLFSIVSKDGRIVGRAKIIKFNNNKVVLKFTGEAQKGYKILSQDYVVPTNTSLNNADGQPASLSQDSIAYSNEHKKTGISTGQYVTGGILGTLIGLGVGHAIQERYTENGWLFTVSQLGSVFSLGYFANQKNDLWTGLSALALIGFKIWELIDVWWLPSSHKIALYEEENSFYIAPLLYSYNNSSQKIFGLSLGLKW